MLNDVARAYFNAPNLTPTLVELCDEDREPGDEGMCGELLVSTYGTKPAAKNWTTLVTENGFKRTRACTCMFRHPERDVDLMVHGVDFISTGDAEDLAWLKELFEKQLEISTNAIRHEPSTGSTLKC